MVRVHYRTLRDIDDAGWDIRLWCYACQRERTLDGIHYMLFEQRRWDQDIAAARRRFVCSECHSSDDVLLLPPTPIKPRGKVTGSSVVEYWFHNKRGRKGSLLL